MLPPPPPRCAAEAPVANRSAEDAECRVVVEDISARKRAEQALRQQTEELRRRNEGPARHSGAGPAGSEPPRPTSVPGITASFPARHAGKQDALASNSPGGQTSRRPPSRRTRSAQPPRTSPRCRLPAGARTLHRHFRARAVVHSVRDPTLSRTTDPRLTAVGRGDRVKFPLRQRDLKDFEPRAGADLRQAAEAARQTAEHLKLIEPAQPPAALGAGY